MIVTKCNAKLIPDTMAFYRNVVDHLEHHINYPKWTDEHPSEQDILDAVKNGEQYICLDGDNIVGAFVLNEDPAGYYEAGEWTMDLQRGEFLIVHLLAVSPDCYRKGVGNMMVDECIAVAKSGGYKAIRLDVVPGNDPAVKLYTKNGFTYAGTKDLRRGYDYIPVFDLYELNLP